MDTQDYIKPTDLQVGGTHYKAMTIQPIQLVRDIRLSFIEGNVLKYVTRFKYKNGKQDLEKAIHYMALAADGYNVGIRTTELSEERQELLAFYCVENAMDDELFDILLEFLNFKHVHAKQMLTDYMNSLYKD